MLSHTNVLQVNISDDFDGDLAVTYISIESRSLTFACKCDRAINSIPIALLSHTDVLQVKITDEFDDDLAVTYISIESRSHSLLVVSTIEPSIVFRLLCYRTQMFFR